MMPVLVNEMPRFESSVNVAVVAGFPHRTRAGRWPGWSGPCQVRVVVDAERPGRDRGDPGIGVGARQDERAGRRLGQSAGTGGDPAVGQRRGAGDRDDAGARERDATVRIEGERGRGRQGATTEHEPAAGRATGRRPKAAVVVDAERPGRDGRDPGIGIGARQHERAGGRLGQSAGAGDDPAVGQRRGAGHRDRRIRGEPDPSVGIERERRGRRERAAIQDQLAGRRARRCGAEPGIGADCHRPEGDGGGAA